MTLEASDAGRLQIWQIHLFVCPYPHPAMRLAHPIDLAPLQVDVFTLAPHALAAAVLQAKEGKLLDANERGRHARLLKPSDQHVYLASHVMLRHVLGAHLGVAPSALRFAQGPWGRPVLSYPMQDADQGVDFNLSHTSGLCACAITRGTRVGIDVEKIDASFHTLFDSPDVLALPERDALHQLPADARPRAFFHYWTLKEACTKAVGKGLLMSPADVPFSLAGDRFTLNCTLGGLPAKDWHVETRVVETDWVMSLAFRKGRRATAITWHEWRPDWA